MKVGVWLLDDYSKKIGGGFSYYDKLIESIDNYNFEDIDIQFISKNRINKTNKAIIYLPEIKKNILWKFVYKIKRKLFIILFNKTIDYNKEKYSKYLKDNNVDIIYYPVQTMSPVEDIPYITTNWDIGHKSSHFFPEFIFDNTFESRDNWYRNSLLKSFCVFCESEFGKNELVKYTGINPAKVKIVHIFPGKVVDLKINQSEQVQILKKYNLVKNKYFFYPAQFWAHKNHYGLLKAFKEVLKTYSDLKIVLTGADKGNLEYINEIIYKLNITDQVIITGFVELEDIYTFYKNAVSLVMPTYLGPTNMPLLEALYIGCPVICSDFEGHREMMNNAAFYFKPELCNDIKECMLKVINNDERLKLLQNAEKTISNNKFTCEQALSEIKNNILELTAIRKCWK